MDILNQIITAINTAVDPFSSPENRVEANNFIELVKNGSNLNSQDYFTIAFKLLNYKHESSNLNDKNVDYIKFSNINNFGLQLMENMVKLNWNKLDQSCKDKLKLFIENIICKKDIDVVTLMNVYENRLLKDQFSKLLVEILMREWPQNWPNFLNLCFSQPKNELVLFCFWRLSEDVGIFFLPTNPQRRRDIHSELRENINFILNYIADCLILENKNLTVLALQTLCSFIEWANFEPEVLTYLSKLLTIEMSDTDAFLKLCYNVADCLFTCLNRKSFKPEERKVLLVFFLEENINVLISFLEKLIFFVQHKIENKVIDEKTFELIKRVCNIFSLMGQTCLSICTSLKINLPNTWQVYLQVMLKLFEYENQIYNYYALQFWKDLFKNHQLKEKHVSDEVFLKIINILPYKMVRKDEISNIFLVYEFDGNADYEVFYVKFKAELGEFLKNLTKYNETQCFAFAINLVKQALETKNLNKNEWETISTILESVCSNLQNVDNFRNEALPVLNFFLTMENNDNFDLMSILISCISSLSTFIPSTNGINFFKELLSKIFSFLNIPYSSDDTNEENNKKIRDLRRHVCFLFIKLSLKYSKSFLPMFDDIKKYIFDLNYQQETEKCLLVEGLIILSNDFPDYFKQKEFLMEILTPVNWLLKYNMTTVEFVHHIGLTLSVENWENFSSNRKTLIYAVNIITVMLKRVKKKNSLLPEFLPYIASLNKLIINLNEMWNSEIQKICYPDYKETIYSPLLDVDRNLLLEGYCSVQNKNDISNQEFNVKRMQTFLWLLHNNCFTSIGCATNLLGLEYYNNLETEPLFHSIDCLPDFKFKTIFRVCLKPIISNCPKNEKIYQQKIYPICNKFLPAFFNKINSKWDIIKNSRDNDLESDQPENDYLEEQICRLLSKEFADLLNILLFEKQSTEEEKFSQLGFYILKQLPDLIYMTATLMTWLDSNISLKATNTTLKLIEKLIEDDLIKSQNSISYFMKQVLIALGYFGEHDNNQALLISLFLSLYENYILRNDFKELKVQLANYCGQNLRSWNSFDEKWIKNANAKKKKAALKNLLVNVIGKNLSQLYKHSKEEIKNLEPLSDKTHKILRKKDKNSFYDDDNIDNISDTFFKFLW